MKTNIFFALFFACGIVFANAQDGVPILSDDPTEEQMELVRQGALVACESVEDENDRQQCVADYYTEHNLEEEPSCD